MLDFTSAHYLGLEHPSRALGSFARLTRGVPAALRPTPGSAAVERALAALVGCERAILGTSTLHLFHDLFAAVAGDRISILFDAGAYPIARWGVGGRAGRGVPVAVFGHHDPRALLALVRRGAGAGRRPVVVCDGFCPGCGRSAPLAAYLRVVRRAGGLLVVDDSQALGLLGESPGASAPYGRGGGGSLRRLGIGGGDVVAVSSLAKAFGAPLAAAAGSEAMVELLDRRGETRVHCSPPSVAVVRAAARALAVNARRGDELRRRLAANVRRFRRRLAAGGLGAAGGLFPVQTLAPIAGVEPARLHGALARRGVGSLLVQRRCSRSAAIGFVITAAHRPAELETAAAVSIETAWMQRRRPPARGRRQRVGAG